MTSEPFHIGAEGVDAEALVRDLREAVDQKVRDGLLPDPAVARAERHNLAYLRDQDSLMEYYMACLREAVYVDINDFEIRERRRFGARPLKALKTAIWKLLKFYTYRLWSQQNQANGLLVAAVDGVDQKLARKIADQETRIAALEKRLADLEARGGTKE